MRCTLQFQILRKGQTAEVKKPAVQFNFTAFVITRPIATTRAQPCCLTDNILLKNGEIDLQIIADRTRC